MINDYPQALTIAGTDSGGGAGIPADVKTMQMRGVYSAMVVVAVTAQNTLGVQDALPMPEKLIDEQFASIAGDLKIRACKTGMLADPLRVRTVVRNLKKYDLGPLIVDPVMVTPNIPEACELTEIAIRDKNDIKKAARELQKRGAKNILIKGGHAESSDKADDYILFEDGNDMWLTAPRVNTKNTHGTGDTISACITAEIAKGHSMEQAIMIGKTYVEKTISKGINVGHGHGPLNHWVKIEGDDLK